MLTSFVSMWLLAAAPPSAGTVAGKPKLVVVDLIAAGGLDEKTAAAFTESVTTEVVRAGYFDAVTTRDVATLAGLERQRQMLGCSDESTTCLTELAGALGARFVLSGTLAKLGASFQISLQVMDTARAQPLGRTTKMAKDLSTLRGVLPLVVAEASGTPMPPAPSRLLSYSLIGAGAAVLIASGYVGVDAISRDRSLSDELSGSSTLHSLGSYTTESQSIGSERTIALVGVIAGAAVVGAGIYLIPSGVPGAGSMALLPAGNGFAFAGSF